MAVRRALEEVGMKGPDQGFWRQQRVFLTGHTGFKGSWLSIWLAMMGAAVRGYALAPNTDPALFDVARVGSLVESEIGDIDDFPTLAASMAAFAPTVVIHMAAQPLVRQSYVEPRATFATNLLGTVNVIEAARAVPGLGSVFVITTDKCYENLEDGVPYRETDRLGGRDPYSASKACAEIATASYFWSFFRGSSCALASGRAGNVIGGGDWALDRLVPDLMRAFSEGRTAVLRNPEATRPWQHVLEPLTGYLLAIEQGFGRPGSAPSAWNFGPDAAGNGQVGEVATVAASAWGHSARVTIQRDPSAPHEAKLLSLDSAKSRADLRWAPRWSMQEAVYQTVDWYRAFYGGADALDLCRRQIEAYAGAPVLS